jgi:hypothetical protein
MEINPLSLEHPFSSPGTSMQKIKQKIKNNALDSIKMNIIKTVNQSHTQFLASQNKPQNIIILQAINKVLFFHIIPNIP